MLHTTESEERQFRQLRAGVEREFNRSTARPPAPQGVSTNQLTDGVARPILELQRPPLHSIPSTLTPTTNFRKASISHK